MPPDDEGTPDPQFAIVDDLSEFPSSEDDSSQEQGVIQAYDAAMTANVPPLRVIIDRDLPCRRREYNLRGLTDDARCPECGTPTAFSLQGDLLRFAAPEWLAKLHRGANLMLVGVMMGLAVVGILIGTTFYGTFVYRTFGIAPGFFLGLDVAVLVAYLLYIVGVWLITARDPGGSGEDRYGRSRKFIRIALIVGLVNSFLRSTATHRYLPWGLAVTVLTGTFLIWFAGFVVQLRYFSRLCDRIPDRELSARARFLMYAIPISVGVPIIAVPVLNYLSARHTFQSGAIAATVCGFLICAAFIGIFAVMYLLMIGKFGSRVQQQIARAKRMAEQN